MLHPECFYRSSSVKCTLRNMVNVNILQPPVLGCLTCGLCKDLKRTCLWRKVLFLWVQNKSGLVATVISRQCYLKEIILEVITFSAFLQNSEKSRNINKEKFFSSSPWSMWMVALHCNLECFFLFKSLPDSNFLWLFMRR